MRSHTVSMETNFHVLFTGDDGSVANCMVLNMKLFVCFNGERGEGDKRKKRTEQRTMAMKEEDTKEITVDPRVTTGLTYEQLGLRPKF